MLIIRHVRHEGPGFLSGFLDSRQIAQELRCIESGNPLPDSVAGFDGLVLMGGPMSVNDPLPWIPRSEHLIRDAVDRGIPVLGHCLGGQLISKALGGEVTLNPVPEFGWQDVRCADTPEARHWLQGLPDPFPAFHWHGETFSLPEGAVHLLSSEYCHNQAFAFGPTLAFQCHIEMTQELITDWVGRAGEGELIGSDNSPSADTVLRQTPDKLPKMQAVAEVLYDRWLEGVSR